MREIKFRAWDKEEKRMRFQSDPWLIEAEYGYICFPLPTPLKSGDSGKYDLMRYTGFKDKNGKEIYEGDILKIGGCRWEVYMEESYMAWYIRHEVSMMQLWSESKRSEVVGNIYENIDLAPK